MGLDPIFGESGSNGAVNMRRCRRQLGDSRDLFLKGLTFRYPSCTQLGRFGPQH
jgi:hypothetical protein